MSEQSSERDAQKSSDTGVEGQIMYPEAQVDPERAGQYAAGKVDTLYPDEGAKDNAERHQQEIDTGDDRGDIAAQPREVYESGQEGQTEQSASQRAESSRKLP